MPRTPEDVRQDALALRALDHAQRALRTFQAAAELLEVCELTLTHYDDQDDPELDRIEAGQSFHVPPHLTGHFTLAYERWLMGNVATARNACLNRGLAPDPFELA